MEGRTHVLGVAVVVSGVLMLAACGSGDAHEADPSDQNTETQTHQQSNGLHSRDAVERAFAAEGEVLTDALDPATEASGPWTTVVSGDPNTPLPDIVLAPSDVGSFDYNVSLYPTVEGAGQAARVLNEDPSRLAPYRQLYAANVIVLYLDGTNRLSRIRAALARLEEARTPGS